MSSENFFNEDPRHDQRRTVLRTITALVDVDARRVALEEFIAEELAFLRSRPNPLLRSPLLSAAQAKLRALVQEPDEYNYENNDDNYSPNSMN